MEIFENYHTVWGEKTRVKECNDSADQGKGRLVQRKHAALNDKVGQRTG